MTAVEQQAVTDIETLVEEKASDRIKEWTLDPHIEFCKALRELVNKMYSLDTNNSLNKNREMTFTVRLESSHNQFTTDPDIPCDSKVFSFTGNNTVMGKRYCRDVSALGNGIYITVVVIKPSRTFTNLARNNSLVQSNFKGFNTANDLGCDILNYLGNDREDSLALTWPQFLDITREYHTQLALQKIACDSLPVDSKEMPF